MQYNNLVCFYKVYLTRHVFLYFLGDITHKPFISSDADVASFQLTTQDEYIVIACDGLWDVLDPMQVSR